MINLRNVIGAAVLACLLSGCCPDGCRTESAPTAVVSASAPAAPAAAETYVKTELYFGLSKPGGGTPHWVSTSSTNEAVSRRGRAGACSGRVRHDATLLG